MTKSVGFFLGLFSIVLDGYCQLPLLTYTSKAITTTIQPVVLDTPRHMISLVAIAYNQAAKRRKWYYQAELSMMERIYPNAVVFAPRGNHISTELIVGRKIKTLAELQFTSFTVWDNRFCAPATQLVQFHGILRLNNGIVLSSAVETRYDCVGESFELKHPVLICPGKHQSGTLQLGIQGSNKGKLQPYLDNRIGSYYGYTRYTSRAGLHLSFSPGSTLFGDCEFNRVIGKTGRADGIFVRAGFDKSINRNFSFKITNLHNTYLGLAAVMIHARYKLGSHTFSAEYRELRDHRFRLLEVSNFWFASQFMFQYIYRING